jgi:hypothetical protein
MYFFTPPNNGLELRNFHMKFFKDVQKYLRKF